MKRNLWRHRALICSLGMLLALTSCGKTSVGDPCKQDGDCPSGLCLSAAAGFPEGYCSLDCSAAGATCEAGQICTAQSDTQAVCLRGCTQSSDCRDGSQCYEGVCKQRCQNDGDCNSDGYTCDVASGACMPRPGAGVGEVCGNDSDCSSQACIGGKCAQGCNRETGCVDGETCVLDRGAMRLRGYCTQQRTAASRAPLNSCSADGDCQRGSCVMGVCLIMCQHPLDCAAAPDGQSCAEVPAPLTKLLMNKWPHMKSCLPKNQNLTVPVAGLSGIQTLLVPATARSVTLVLAADKFDQNVTIGMSLFQDDAGQLLYGLWSPGDANGYFKNPIRSTPALGSAIFRLSSSPRRVPIRTAAYQYSVMTSDALGRKVTPSMLAIYKLLEQAPAHGTIPLRLHVTDLSGLPSSCMFRTMKANNAQAMLAPVIERLSQIYAQNSVQVTFSPITYVDSEAPSSVDLNDPTSLGDSLSAAAKNTGGGLDLVLIRSITPDVVLGIAGGIPGSPGVKDDPHTGAVMSMGYVCMDGMYGLTDLAQTAAHELGHTLGLNHNIESNMMTDPLGDGTGLSESAQQEAANLMYYLATDMPGQSLTTEQGQVIRATPQLVP